VIVTLEFLIGAAEQHLIPGKMGIADLPDGAIHHQPLGNKASEKLRNTVQFHRIRGAYFGALKAQEIERKQCSRPHDGSSSNLSGRARRLRQLLFRVPAMDGRRFVFGAFTL
jgi:hypothetical protein